MARVLGKSVTVSDSIVDGEPQGRVHTILLEDHEKVPMSAADVEELLARDADAVPVVMEVALDGAVKEQSEDETQVLLAVLDELAASKDVSVETWKQARMAEATGAGPVVEGPMEP